MKLHDLCDTMRQTGAALSVASSNEAADYFTFSGIATTPKVDLIGDVVEPLGARFTLPIKLLSKHDSSKPIGEVFAAKATAKGISYSARIPLVKEAGIVKDRIDEAVHEIKYGLVSNVSIGFKAIKDAIELLDEGLRFKEWRWLELSLAPIPANDEATITSFKSLDANIRAALGLENVDVQPLGIKPSGAPGQRPKGSTMRTIKQLQERRDEIAARMKELNEGCGGDFAALDETERAEFDGLTADLETTDVDLRRAKAVESAARGAVAVTPQAGTDPEAASRSRGGIGVQLKTPPAEKGIALAQYVKYLGRAKGNVMLAASMAKSAGSAIDRRVSMLFKNTVEGGTVTGTPTAGNWGMELVGTETGAFADFVEFLRPSTILGKFGQNGIPALRRVPFRVPLVGMTSGGTGYWVGEGKGKPVTKFGFSRTHLDPLKVAAICVLSDELLADSSPAADPLIRDQLAAALRELEDQTFIDPAVSGTPGQIPASITNGISAIPSSGTNAAAVRTDIGAVFGSFIDANNAPSSGVWVMSEKTALSLSLMTNALGQPEFPNVTMMGGTFAGLPVITSQYVPTDSNGGMVFLINAQDVYYGDDGGINVATSQHASIEMSDAPANDIIAPTASAYTVSMFQTDSTAFRVEQRLDWMRRRESAVAALSGVAWA